MNIFRLFLIVIGVICGTLLLNSAGGPWLGAILGWMMGEQLRLRNQLINMESRLTELMTVTSLSDSGRCVESEIFSETHQDNNNNIKASEDPLQESPAIKSNFNIRQRFWSFVAGENPLARVGVLLLFFGVAFLFKYVASGIEISLEWRFIVTALGGLALLGVGWRLRDRRPGYAMVVQGGGIGIWYLTVFVALRFGLVPTELAFPLLVTISVFSALLALGQDSSALALFGAAGGYLAPVLIATKGGRHVELFIYYTLLNAGVLGLAWFKAWRSLNLLGFLFTFTISGLWAFSQYRPRYFPTTEPFMVLFFIMYVMVTVLFSLRQPPRLKGLVDGGLVFGLPVVAGGLQSVLVHHLEFGMAWSALVLGGVYLGLSAWLWKREGERLRLLCESFLALGVVFATITIPLAMDGRWTAAAWSLEGAALVWIGVRQGRLLVRLTGSLLQLISGMIFAQSWIGPGGMVPILNAHCLGGLLIAMAGIFSALQLDYHRTSLRSWEHMVKGLFLTWGLLWWYGTGAHEIERFVAPWAIRTVLLLFLTSSAAASITFRPLLGSRLAAVSAGLLLPGMGVMRSGVPLVLLFAFFFPFLPVWMGMQSILDFPFDFQMIGLPLIFWWSAWALAFIVQYWGLRRLDGDFPNTRTRHFWHVGTLWILAWVIAVELSNLAIGLSGGSAWEIIAWGMVPAGLAWWVMEYGPSVLPWPFDKYRESYLHLGCGVLLIYAWGWALYANITSDGAAWPLSYVPILNPLDLTLAFVMLTLAHWWGTTESPPWRIVHGEKLTKGFAASVFLIINGVVARTIHHWGNVPYHWHDLFASSTFQSSLSLLWSILALTVMAVATRRGWRRGWIAGAMLLAVVVAKLFLIELENHGTLARIVSFLGVGTLLLIIGYLAPPPQNLKK